MESFKETLEDGKYSLEAIIVDTGAGISVLLGGGEEPHIGSIAVSIPRESLTGNGSVSCTTSVFNMISHKDDSLSVPLSEELCIKTDLPVVVTAGVHIEKAGLEEIKRIEKNFQELKDRILKKFSKKQRDF